MLVRIPPALFLLLVGPLLGCPSEDPYERLNGDEDCLAVVVSPLAAVLQDLAMRLR